MLFLILCHHSLAVPFFAASEDACACTPQTHCPIVDWTCCRPERRQERDGGRYIFLVSRIVSSPVRLPLCRAVQETAFLIDELGDFRNGLDLLLLEQRFTTLRADPGRDVIDGHMAAVAVDVNWGLASLHCSLAVNALHDFSHLTLYHHECILSFHKPPSKPRRNARDFHLTPNIPRNTLSKEQHESWTRLVMMADHPTLLSGRRPPAVRRCCPSREAQPPALSSIMRNEPNFPEALNWANVLFEIGLGDRRPVGSKQRRTQSGPPRMAGKSEARNAKSETNPTYRTDNAQNTCGSCAGSSGIRSFVLALSFDIRAFPAAAGTSLALPRQGSFLSVRAAPNKANLWRFRAGNEGWAEKQSQSDPAGTADKFEARNGIPETNPKQKNGQCPKHWRRLRRLFSELDHSCLFRASDFAFRASGRPLDGATAGGILAGRVGLATSLERDTYAAQIAQIPA